MTELMEGGGDWGEWGGGEDLGGFGEGKCDQNILYEKNL